MNAGPAGTDAIAHVFVDALIDDLIVEGEDGHHLQRVRRLAKGEYVTAADGTGAWRAYAVTDAAAGRITLRATAGITVDPEPPTVVALAVALPKGGLDDVVAAVTELGVVRITPLRATRAVARWEGARATRSVERLQAVVRAAAMQSRRSRLPVVDPVTDLATVLERPGVVVADHRAQPGGVLEPPLGEWTVVIGPEGGFDPAERALLAARPHLAIGHHVLRAATAPVAAVAVLTDRIAQMRHP